MCCAEDCSLSVLLKCYKCVLSSYRWDNGEREKMSPWDIEPIPQEGAILFKL